MPKPKKTPEKSKSKKEDPRVEREYEEEIEITCPISGKKIKQKVKVIRYKTPAEQSKYAIPTDSIIDKLDSTDDGLTIYNGDDE